MVNKNGATTISDEFVAACGDVVASVSVHDNRILLRGERGGRALPVELRLGILVGGVDLGSRLAGIAYAEAARLDGAGTLRTYWR